jgi:hypothetical protein
MADSFQRQLCGWPGRNFRLDITVSNGEYPGLCPQRFISLLGLVLFLLVGASSHLIRFTLVSLALMGILYPKRIE